MKHHRGHPPLSSTWSGGFLRIQGLSKGRSVRNHAGTRNISIYIYSHLHPHLVLPEASHGVSNTRPAQRAVKQEDQKGSRFNFSRVKVVFNPTFLFFDYAHRSNKLFATPVILCASFALFLLIRPHFSHPSTTPEKLSARVLALFIFLSTCSFFYHHALKHSSYEDVISSSNKNYAIPSGIIRSSDRSNDHSILTIIERTRFPSNYACRMDL